MFNKVFNIFFSNQIYSCTGFFNHLCMIGIGSPLNQKKKKKFKTCWDNPKRSRKRYEKVYLFKIIRWLRWFKGIYRPFSERRTAINKSIRMTWIHEKITFNECIGSFQNYHPVTQTWYNNLMRWDVHLYV